MKVKLIIVIDYTGGIQKTLQMSCRDIQFLNYRFVGLNNQVYFPKLIFYSMFPNDEKLHLDKTVMTTLLHFELQV